MTGICAGKRSVAEYLIQEHGFRSLRLSTGSATPLTEEPDNNRRLLSTYSDDYEDNRSQEAFLTIDALLEFVTKRWREHWVTADIWDEGTLEALSRRPFFILVSVDAPVSLRWKRFSERYVRCAVLPTPLC